ncbi:hypothetical protein [Fluviicola sp.]|uniref:hypothetical protein n=1 Tax=Fluviicola sp. TaxID=1917219 RepID=UPI0031D58657
MKTLLFICCSLSCLVGISQERKTLDAKSFNNEMALLGKKMNAELVSCRFKKEIFKDIRSSEIIESSSGEVIRGKGFEFKMSSPGIINMQKNNLQVLIDSSERIVYISNIDSSMRQIAQLQQIPLDALKDYKLEKISFPTYYILRAEPQNASIGTMELYVHNNTTELYKLNIFYPPGNYFSESMEDESVESPYLTIIFEPMKKLKGTDELISLKNILEINAAGDYILAPAMSGFQLKDTRYKPTK